MSNTTTTSTASTGTKTSPMGAINWNDLLHGLLLATITSVLAALYTGLVDGAINWKTIGITAATTAVGYLLKALGMPATVPASSVMKVLVLLLVCAFMLAPHKVAAQSMFKPIPAPAAPMGSTNRFSRAITIVDTVPAGSNFLGLRFTGPTVLYFNNAGGQSGIGTFIGIDYESDYWDAAASKSYTNWAIGLQGGEGGSVAPSSLSLVTLAALTLSTQRIGSFELPFKLTVAAVYNLNAGKFLPGVGPGIPLNN